MLDKNLESLKNQLNQLDWPNIYFYKFIIPNNPESIAKVCILFDNDSVITYQPSSKGNYTSVSVKELALNSEIVIEKYRKALNINGLIAL